MHVACACGAHGSNVNIAGPTTHQTLLQEVIELRGPLVWLVEGGRQSFGDLEQYTHRVHIMVGWHHLRQLDKGDPERPDVRLVVIAGEGKRRDTSA